MPPTEPPGAEPAYVAVEAPHAGHGTWALVSRWTAGVVVLLLAAVLGGVAVIATYVRDQVLDTNTYVATVAPLGANPTVQTAIAQRLSTEIVKQTDIAGTANDLANRLVQQGAPARVKDLVPPLVSGIQTFLDDTIKKLLATSEFEQLWNQINGNAHASLVAVLTGTKHGAVSSSGDAVTIDLGVILQRVKQRRKSRTSRSPTQSYNRSSCRRSKATSGRSTPSPPGCPGRRGAIRRRLPHHTESAS
jgi:hypothetical protein